MRILEEERLILLGAAAGLAASRREGDPENALRYLESSLNGLRTFASIASLVLDAAAAGPSLPGRLEPMLDIIGGLEPTIFDGDDRDLFGNPLRPPQLRVSLNDPKTFYPPIWDPILDCALWAALAAMNLSKYYVSSITPLNACPGDTITITGQGFGNKPGKIIFQMPDGSGALANPQGVWTDTQIKSNGAFRRRLRQHLSQRL